MRNRRRFTRIVVPVALTLAWLAAAPRAAQTQNLAPQRETTEKPPSLPAAETADWFDWSPASGDDDRPPAFDLRSLNEAQAGDGGFIGIRSLPSHDSPRDDAPQGVFIQTRTGQPIRFWGVNGPPASAHTFAELQPIARRLASYGVNLVRVHGAVFDQRGEPDLARVRHVQDIVAAMKEQGIYTHLSIYFPLWFKPPADLAWLPGYDGQKHPFAALQFNPEFQKRYAAWWRAILLTPHPETRVRLVDEPALMGVEIQNEDSYFFWTFSDKNIPDPQLRQLESQFADWLVARYGSLDAALARWPGPLLPRDNAGEKRVAFRPLWNMAHERTARDRDTVRFLAEHQRAFYQRQVALLRELGFRACITCSNWTTADPRYLGPLEKYTYAVGDFQDRHGYFSCGHEGTFSEWSIREGHTYRDRSALRFDPVKAGQPRSFGHPVVDTSYDDKPTMLSETTWNRPNRHRSEAPFFYAVYGALQDADAIVHFALDGGDWSVKPNFFMQPWTLMSPSQMGQFPVAALLYRRRLIDAGDVLVDLRLDPQQLLDLAGTPLPPDASLDELRLQDVPLEARQPSASDVIDPLVHFAGRTRVRFATDGPPSQVADLRPWIDRTNRRVVSSTRQVQLDYGHGLLTVQAPQVRLASGNLAARREIVLGDVAFSSPLDLAHFALVSLDGRPLEQSQRILLQVMTEERSTGFRSEPADDAGTRRITSLGVNPWQVRRLAGQIRLMRPDAAQFRLTPLDPRGRPFESPAQPLSLAADGRFTLLPDAPYYLIDKGS